MSSRRCKPPAPPVHYNILLSINLTKHEILNIKMWAIYGMQPPYEHWQETLLVTTPEDITKY